MLNVKPQSELDRLFRRVGLPDTKVIVDEMGKATRSEIWMAVKDDGYRGKPDPILVVDARRVVRDGTVAARCSICIDTLMNASELTRHLAMIAHDIRSRLDSDEDKKQSLVIAKDKMHGYTDENGNPSKLLNAAAEAMRQRHAGGVLKNPSIHPAPLKGRTITGAIVDEFPDIEAELSATEKEHMSATDGFTATERMDMIVAAIGDVNDALIQRPNAGETSDIWASIRTAGGEPYQLESELECVFHRLIYKAKMKRVVIHVQSSIPDSPLLCIYADEIEDILPGLENRINAELEAGGFFPALADLDDAANKLVADRATIAQVLEDATYKTVTAAVAKSGKLQQKASETRYAANPLYGTL